MIQNFNGTKILTTQLTDEQNFGELAASFIKYKERSAEKNLDKMLLVTHEIPQTKFLCHTV